MKIGQNSKLVVYIYAVLVESIASHWILTVMPQIITHNFKITSDSQKSTIASHYFISFFVGLIAGSFLWPFFVNYLSKRNCILGGLVCQAVANIFVGRSTNLLTMNVFRFLFGLSQTINTVGKDYIYVFVDADKRQFLFTMRSIAVMISSLIGPLIGYHIYYGTGKSFEQSTMYISAILLTGSFLFFCFFYLIFPANDVVENLEEEEVVMIESNEELADQNMKNKQINLKKILKFILKHNELRNCLAGIFLVIGVYSTQMFVTFFYMEIDWKDQGLGLSDQEVSYLTVLVALPIVVLYLVANHFVPKRISMFTFIKLILIPNIILLALLPALRDLLQSYNALSRYQIISLVVCLYFVFNLNFLSPSTNYYMNSLVPKNGRTSLNSITFLGVCISIILINLTIVPFFSITMFDERFSAWKPYNKYICFCLFDILLIAAAILLREPKINKVIV